MTIQMTLALRYLGGRKLRTFLTTLAIVFGVLVLFGMNIIAPSMLKALQANEMAISGQVDTTITHVSGDAFDYSIYNQVSRVEGVSAAAAYLERTVNLPADFFDQNAASTDKVTTLVLEGIDPESARSVRAYPVMTGRFLTGNDTQSAVITPIFGRSALAQGRGYFGHSSYPGGNRPDGGRVTAGEHHSRK